MREVLVHLGLGANEGDREGNIRAALERLGTAPGVRVLRVSQLRESAPQGRDGAPAPRQGDYLNGVAELATTLPAHALLALCKALEAAAGRKLPARQDHPRQLDLDLLLYGDQRIDTRDLVVPHPRILERPFVLEPLRELGVDERHLRALLAPGPVLERTARGFSARCAAYAEGGALVGIVPTMGALHRGHQSLLDRARAECDRVVATIFVNPLQFGPNDDLAQYPRDLERDLGLCREAGVDLVFAPAVEEMYPPGFCSAVAVGDEAQTMEGASRPTHFAGVATVVARLFALGRPHRAYFGLKDAQQVAVVRRMTEDLGFATRIVECPIVREPDGLALSSRNVYLGAEDRKAATVLYRALRQAQQAFRAGERDRDALLLRARRELAAEPRAEIDYLELRSDGDLRPLPAGRVDGGRMLVAVRFKTEPPVRLLDNMRVDAERDEPAEWPARGAARVAATGGARAPARRATAEGVVHEGEATEGGAALP